MEGSALQKILDPIRAWARINSPWAIHFNSGSCNGCDIEILATLTPRYDLERFGVKLHGSPRHADVLICTGPVTLQASDAERQYGPNPCRKATGPQQSACTSLSDKQADRAGAAKIFNVMVPLAIGSAVATGVVYALWPSDPNGSAQQIWLIPTANQNSGGLTVQAAF